MRSYRALIALDLKLALRQRSVIFFNYLFPLVFFFIFGQSMHAERGSAITFIIAMVLIIGILGNGLFGAGIRAVQEREANILRRYKVAPISPVHLLTASVATGWILYMPNVLLILALAHFVYGMPWPHAITSILTFVSVAIAGFRALGLIVAAVVNSMQESQLVVQLLYLPMLFLSGATFPLALFPPWLLAITQFVPTTYLVIGIQGMLLRNEGMMANLQPTMALAGTALLGVFIASQLFRWEKQERIRPAAKLWLIAVLTPFLALGIYEIHNQAGASKAKVLQRRLARGQAYLIRGARIFVGNGQVLEDGSVLVREGKIAQVYHGAAPDPNSLKAEAIEAAGKTLLPGLIDVHVHLGAPGGFYPEMSKYDPKKNMLRHLAAYLYSGVTTVRSVGDNLDMVLEARALVNRGEFLGAEVSTCGPLFTAAGGHGTEYFRNLAPALREKLAAQFTRLPGSPDEAREQVDALKQQGVDCIKAILESGAGERTFNRLDTRLFGAVAQEAHRVGLPLVVHTGDARDVADAVADQADSVEHGSFRQRIPERLFEQMARQKTYYCPTLSVAEAFKEFAAGKTDLLRRSLVLQVAPHELLEATEAALSSQEMEPARKAILSYPIDMGVAIDNLRLAEKQHVLLVAGSDAGNYLVIHGPTVQHELQLWVQAGMAPAVALQAATLNAARLLRADQKIGSIEAGRDADLLLVDGNPIEDITASERISLVFFKGERVERTELLDQQ